MKILYRIMDIFCHPSRIVFYYKDKIYVLIIHLLAFAAMAVGVTAALSYTDYYISREDGNDTILFDLDKKRVKGFPPSSKE